MLIVFVIVTIMSALLLSNSRTVITLDQELDLVQKRQVQHWKTLGGHPEAPEATGASPVTRP